MAAVATAPVAQPAPTPASMEDSSSTSTRFTRDGRKLSYQLNVLQQPDRARACGQGAKSSSDRRPVDPPPIVELHVFEGEEKRDVTLTYNASLFLCATLESSRAIAHVRGSHASGGTPVLTGTPVAGISYLDRPVPAGYFIFTDLSVRHEGHYKLSFTLFEELKEHKDQDVTASQNDQVGVEVYARCAVTSRPFEVYSAKKFPGLTESTILSRVVADQGCRVRIRRDIRLRRRESKPGDKDWDEPADGKIEEVVIEENKQIVPSSPEVKAATEKAATNNSDNPQALQVAYQHHAASQPQAYQTNSAYSMPASNQQMQHYAYQHQQPQYSQAYAPQYQQQSQYMQHQPYGHYQQYNPYGYHTAGAGIPPPAYGYMPQQQQMQQHQQQQQIYGQQQHQEQPHHMQMQQQMRLESKGYAGLNREAQSFAGQQQQVNASYPHSIDQQQQAYNQQAAQQQQHQQQPQAMLQPNTTSLPSVKPSETPLPTPTFPHSAAASPTTAQSSSMYSFQSQPAHHQTQTNHPRPPPPTFSTQPTAGYASKRSYGSTFSTSHLAQPLRSGARPTFNLDGASDMSPGGALSVDPDPSGSDEDLQDLESIKLTYRRADGSWSLVQPRTF